MKCPLEWVALMNKRRTGPIFSQGRSLELAGKPNLRVQRSVQFGESVIGGTDGLSAEKSRFDYSGRHLLERL